MSASYKFEQSVLAHDEFETIRVTHHPGIYDLTNTDLRDIQVQMRKMRDRERTLARQKKGEPRPASPSIAACATVFGLLEVLSSKSRVRRSSPRNFDTSWSGSA